MFGRFALVTILALTGIAVAACGGSSTPSPTTPPTPVPSTTVWQISGQLTGTSSMSVYSCAPLQGYYQLLLTGQVNGEKLNIFLFTNNTGTLDYASAASAVTVSASLSSTGSQTTSLWKETSGNRGVQGTVVIGADGAGSMSGVVVPPALNAPGGATTNLTLNGEWKCSFPLPS